MLSPPRSGGVPRALAGFLLGAAATVLGALTATSANPAALFANPQLSATRTLRVAVPAPTLRSTALVPLPQRISSALRTATATAPETEAPAPTLLPAERYIASNQFKVRPGAEAKFEARWATRKSRLALLPGFRFFTLMRAVNEAGTPLGDDDYNYVSLTVWENKQAFTEWRTGDAFKEAHGGTDIFSFFKMIVTSLLETRGHPQVALYDALLPIAAPPNPTATVDGWRSVVANGVDRLTPECYVAMQRFTVVPGSEADFEAKWAKRSSSLTNQPGFCGFWLARAGITLTDGANYVAMTVWQDRDSFFTWRNANDPKSRDGPSPGTKTDGLVAWPRAAYYEGVLVIESKAGI
eukprot:TRINITY_DN1080_c0_g1_i1.p1 TRINITY_DN1080_c0_g1~~TRINITY_DN1080_c0_g1_i1.p1  ORF type:complete len:377 (-),score=58.76 TRINITY_DN1080_c0_g1_i1:209-1264(-)